ncbi:hypothetical protein KDW_36490 [Dictyobacter vulcani]|uniref:Uncharacterized protein n=1 Tax=Dictyobacter vulcani TaxID=2607529 RepID=A0A5J4KSU7_9CHLR|nr:hypothetical protein [Dictyobacter vulcani]GER89487.1 hypothetical protein KDW_36490 [Dictyobacter vulcani]
MTQQDIKTRCAHLRRLRDRMNEEIQLLQTTLRETEARGFDNPIQTVDVLKSLQHVCNKVDLELEKCPADDV